MGQVLSAGQLRAELEERAATRALRLAQPHQRVPGRDTSVVFTPGEEHGNFFTPSYRAILAEPAWRKRLGKAHTAYRRSRALATWPWRELDCAASSDALLMNLFCAPGLLGSPRVAALLGVPLGSEASFGFRPRIPLHGGRVDRTEVDLLLGGSLMMEAKLTETGFQTARSALVERFRDLHEVFAVDALPRTRCQPTGRFAWNAGEERLVEQTRGEAGLFLHYQLIRGVLAAYAHGASFCLLADARRCDLREAWFSVLAAVRLPTLRPRLQLLTWQELAGALPAALAEFLWDKYGITPG